MHFSETVKELLPALFSVQNELSGVKPNSTNPHFKSKYADLEAIWEAVHPVLKQAGLLVIQGTNYSDEGIVLLTRIYHAASAEFVESELRLPNTKGDAQGAGSAITYGRRYQLATMLNLYQVDDDGNLASQPAPKQTYSPAPKQSPPKPTEQTFGSAKKQVIALLNAKELKPSLIKQALTDNTKTVGNITEEEAARVLEAIGTTITAADVLAGDKDMLF